MKCRNCGRFIGWENVGGDWEENGIHNDNYEEGYYCFYCNLMEK